MAVVMDDAEAMPPAQGWAGLMAQKIYPLNRAANRTGAGSRTQFASFNFSNALIWEAASSAPRTASINPDATVPASRFHL
jgi:hypothetical protein